MTFSLKPVENDDGYHVFPQKMTLVNPFTPGDFAEKRVFKLVEWFSGHCRAIKS